MNINYNDLFNDNNNDFDCKSAYPLFNFDAIRNSDFNEVPLNLISAQKASEIVEEILCKKVKVAPNTAVTAKKRGRKAIAKDAKEWDDPTITIQEIIDNDLAGTPMKAEIQMREERIKKIQEKKAQRKAEREKGATAEIPAIEAFAPITTTAPTFALEPIVLDNTTGAFAPQIIFKDGKLVIDDSALTIRQDRAPKLTIVENQKPYKLTSMSFRTRNNTAKWTPEETKKFYKAIEIFGADFSLIAKLFPTRNRDQIKNKFNKEEKVNVARMNEAFKRNTVLAKRSIMDRIRNFSTALELEQPAAITNTDEFDIEIGGIKALERQYSNTSTDSMDLKILEEIKDIFIKEIRPRNTGILTATTTTAAPILAINNGITDDKKMVEETRKEDPAGVTAQKENLFFRLIK